MWFQSLSLAQDSHDGDHITHWILFKCHFKHSNSLFLWWNNLVMILCSIKRCLIIAQSAINCIFHIFICLQTHHLYRNRSFVSVVGRKFILKLFQQQYCVFAFLFNPTGLSAYVRTYIQKKLGLVGRTAVIAAGAEPWEMKNLILRKEWFTDNVHLVLVKNIKQKISLLLPNESIVINRSLVR